MTVQLPLVAVCTTLPALPVWAPVFDAAAGLFVDAVDVAADCAAPVERFATATAVATEKNDVTLSPARTIRVVAAGCRRRALVDGAAGGVAVVVEPSVLLGVGLGRPDAARRSCSRRSRSAASLGMELSFIVRLSRSRRVRADRGRAGTVVVLAFSHG